tara:strand:+ start:129 stop:380 length:252 start_codon:yes stop_codon:yes gene_type:complete
MVQLNGYYYSLLLFFGVLFYAVGTQPNTARLFVLAQKYAVTKYRRTKWWLLNNPNNPIVRYFVWRRSIKMATEMKKYFDEKNK